MSRYTKPLLVSPLPDGKRWVIKRDFGYGIKRGQPPFYNPTSLWRLVLAYEHHDD